MSVQPRNPSVEFFRILLMFGICLLHSAKDGLMPSAALANLFMPCVTGFVFITGWYGVEFSIARVCKLFGVVLGCIPAMFVFDMVAGTEISVIRILQDLRSCWFLWDYLVLMCFAPILNVALSSPQAVRILLPVLVVALGWSYGTGLPVVGPWLPKPSGFGNFTFLMMIGVYLAGALWRRRGWMTNAPNAILFGVCSASGVFAAIGFGKYSSPVSIVFIGAAFLLIVRQQLPCWVARISFFLAPSMFSVYVSHTNVGGFSLLRSIELHLLDRHVAPFAVYFCTAVTIFIACVLMDLFFRRMVILGGLRLARGFIERFR